MDLIGFFANSAVQSLGATAILTIVVVMILLGRLVPLGTHKRELDAADKRTLDAVKRGDEWKTAAEKTDEVNKVIREQNGDLIQANKVVEAFLRAAGPTFDTTAGGGRDVA